MGDASRWMDGHDQRKIVLGLERVRELASRLGNPQKLFRAIHVAGSDGKGSVCAMIDSIFRASGISTGLFTSPFLEDRTESISVDGVLITSEQMDSLLEEVKRADEGIGCTYFEILTVTAFLWFARCGVEYAVIETGMGGTGDATNIVVPDVSVITNISMEHTAFLGDTIAEIASHKAGIIKPGVPSVTTAKGDALEVLKRRAAEVGSELKVAEAGETLSMTEEGSEVRYQGETYRIGIPGSYQAENMAAAVEAVLHSSVTSEVKGHIAEGLQSARLYARMEKVPGMPMVIDGTHTVAGTKVLCSDMPELYGHFITVFGVLDDKDAGNMAECLCNASDVVIVTQPESDRAMDAERLYGIVRAYSPDAELYADPDDAIGHAMDISSGRTILITGSFRMAEGALRWLRTRYA